MNKSELIKWVANEQSVSAKQAGENVDAVLAGIVHGIKTDGEVRIPGFGSFLRKLRAARMGVKPTDGSKIMIPARWIASWRVSSRIKDLINENNDA